MNKPLKYPADTTPHPLDPAEYTGESFRRNSVLEWKSIRNYDDC
jgi:hypothetical protein